MTTPPPPKDPESSKAVSPAPETGLQKGEAPPPPEVRRVLESLPQAQREVLERSFAMMYQGPVVNPILTKIDKEHLHKLFDGIENDNKRMYEDRASGRKHGRFIAGLGVLAFLAISSVFLWAQQGDLLKGILIGLALFLGGLGTGSRFLSKQDDD